MPLSKVVAGLSCANHSELSPLERCCFVLSTIPSGSVCSYGRLALLAELSGPRQSCQMLRRLPEGSTLPWHRVVNAQGKLADFNGAAVQKQRLEKEGIVFNSSGRIAKHYFI